MATGCLNTRPVLSPSLWQVERRQQCFPQDEYRMNRIPATESAVDKTTIADAVASAIVRTRLSDCVDY